MTYNDGRQCSTWNVVIPKRTREVEATAYPRQVKCKMLSNLVDCGRMGWL